MSEEERENWLMIRTPLGEAWSGRARYAAAMYFYGKGAMSAEALEAYRICARLDGEDPLGLLRERGIGAEWLERILSGEAAGQP